MDLRLFLIIEGILGSEFFQLRVKSQKLRVKYEKKNRYRNWHTDKNRL